MSLLHPHDPAKEAHERRVLDVGIALDDFAKGYIDAHAAEERLCKYMSADQALDWLARIKKDVR